MVKCDGEKAIGKGRGQMFCLSANWKSQRGRGDNSNEEGKVKRGKRKGGVNPILARQK